MNRASLCGTFQDVPTVSRIVALFPAELLAAVTAVSMAGLTIHIVHLEPLQRRLQYQQPVALTPAVSRC